MKILLEVLIMALFSSAGIAQDRFEKDIIKTSEGDLEITFIGHASLMMKHGARIIHVDPFGKLADYAGFPKADLILVTHEHFDHFDPAAITKLSKPGTAVVLSGNCEGKIAGAVMMANGDVKTVAGIKIEAVPAYNIVNKRGDGQPFHPKGVGNGFILKLGDKRIYVAGDTENTPEMKALKNIDCAFLPMNLPYTMTPEMVADAAKAFKPKILYPYHFGETDTSGIIELLKASPETEVRIRKMQ